MAELHHFTYGWFNPVAAFLMAYLGSLLGLACAVRAGRAGTGGRRARWLVLAAISIGGAGVWLMHFMAVLGFEVVGSPLRLDPLLTMASGGLAVIAVGAGLFIASFGRRRLPRVVLGGLFTGAGVLGMHYAGMLAIRVAGRLEYDRGLVAASAVIAVVAATVALWFAVAVRRWHLLLVAAGIMAVAVCGMHYVGMAAVRVRPAVEPVPVDGINPFLLIVPITLVAAAAIVGVALSALQAMTEEEFSGGPRYARHRVPAPAPARPGGGQRAGRREAGHRSPGAGAAIEVGPGQPRVIDNTERERTIPAVLRPL